MQDLASEFSQIFRGWWYPRTLTARGGDPLPHPTPRPAFGPGCGAQAPRCWVPNLGPPSTFQPWLRPSSVHSLERCTHRNDFMHAHREKASKRLQLSEKQESLLI